MKFLQSKDGLIRRRENRISGLFIDGTGLDRATRRLKKKVDLSALVKGVSSGSKPIVARYYTLIPYEDDSRQRSFLEAVAKAGLTVIVKRLPPKGISRQVSVDIEMAADIIAFAKGHKRFGNLSEFMPGSGDFVPTYGGSALPSSDPFYRANNNSIRYGHDSDLNQDMPPKEISTSKTNGSHSEDISNEAIEVEEKRRIIVVCPSRDLSYPIALATEFGCDTSTADFGHHNSSDMLKSASKWIDLSDSETIWRD